MKPAVVLILRGPQTNVAREVGSRLLCLSAALSGLVIVPAYQEQESKIGDFDVWSPSYQRSNNPIIQWRYLRAISSRIREWEQQNNRKVDLIVTSDVLRIGLLGWILSVSMAKKLIVEVNGDHNHPANYADIESRFLRFIKRFSFVLLEKFILKRADGVKLLYPNQVESLGVGLAGKVVASHFNFVDLNSFANIKDTKTVLLAGFPFAVKGVDILVDAFKIVSEKHPDWRLRIVGYYPDPTEINAAIGGHPAISRSEPVAHSEMPGLMGSCGIYVSASRTEAMGRVLLEAMWCGKPRIASDVGGCWTLIDNKVDGFLFESGNVDQLAALLDNLMSDEALRSRIGNAARKRAVTDFTPEMYCKKTAEFYLKVRAEKIPTGPSAE